MTPSQSPRRFHTDSVEQASRLVAAGYQLSVEVTGPRRCNFIFIIPGDDVESMRRFLDALTKDEVSLAAFTRARAEVLRRIRDALASVRQ